MKLTSECRKCGVFYSYTTPDDKAKDALMAFYAWREEHRHAPEDTAPQTREPARGPGRPKKDN